MLFFLPTAPRPSKDATGARRDVPKDAVAVDKKNPRALGMAQLAVKHGSHSLAHSTIALCSITLQSNEAEK